MAIFVGRPEISLAISQGSMHKIHIEDMSLMCPLYVPMHLSSLEPQADSYAHLYRCTSVRYRSLLEVPAYPSISTFKSEDRATNV